MSGSPCEVWFYHLERATLEAALPELLEKTLARGWRALVRAATVETLDHLDRWLWTWRDDSFLAHGRAEEPSAARQPILLTLGEENANGAQALFLVEGATAPDITAFARCVVIFDGRDEVALAEARSAWAGFKGAGNPVTYWRQGENRGWERQMG